MKRGVYCLLRIACSAIGLSLVLAACASGLETATPAPLFYTSLPAGKSDASRVAPASATAGATERGTESPENTAGPSTPSLAAGAVGVSTTAPTASSATAGASRTPLAPPEPPVATPTVTTGPLPTQPPPTVVSGGTTGGPATPLTYETTVTLLTYPYEQGFVETGPGDPIFPYPRMDFSKIGSPEPRSYKGVVLENGYVSLTILPELGGRIYRWVDKGTGRHLLYENAVVKPTEWGFRGWWLALGGIEWAFPVEEHGLNEWRPWQYTTGYTAHGLSVTVWDVEDRTGMQVGATISLDADHAYVTLQPWVQNDTGETHIFQYWLNAMLTLGGNTVSDQTQFIIPTNQVTVHSTGDGALPGPRQVMDWPVYNGQDLSWYGNWRAQLGFFAPSVTAGYVGLYDHSTGQGIVRIFTPGRPPGTKFFGPVGLPPSMWTDDGSSYVELWSGATESFWSNTTLNPGESLRWTELWYPVRGLGGFTFANESAALRLVDTGGGAQIGVAVTALTRGHLGLWAGGQLAASWPIDLYPGQAFQASWTRPAGVSEALGLRLENTDGVVLAETGPVP